MLTASSGSSRRPRGGRRRQRHDEAVEHLDKALALWRGRPFEEISDLSIGQAPAARLLSMREAAITTRLECSIGGGSDRSGRRRARGTRRCRAPRRTLVGVADDHSLPARPARPTHCAPSKQVRTILAEELGLEPGPELRDLEAKILRHDPSLGPSSRGHFAKSPRRRCEPSPTERTPRRLVSFVGRAAHIDALTIARRRAARHGGRAGRCRQDVAGDRGRPHGWRRVRLGPASFSSSWPRCTAAAMSSLRSAQCSPPVTANCGRTTARATEIDRIIDAIGN